MPAWIKQGPAPRACCCPRAQRDAPQPRAWLWRVASILITPDSSVAAAAQSRHLANPTPQRLLPAARLCPRQGQPGSGALAPQHAEERANAKGLWGGTLPQRPAQGQRKHGATSSTSLGARWEQQSQGEMAGDKWRSSPPPAQNKVLCTLPLPGTRFWCDGDTCRVLTPQAAQHPGFDPGSKHIFGKDFIRQTSLMAYAHPMVLSQPLAMCGSGAAFYVLSDPKRLSCSGSP